jgi:hypothetical protein
MTPDAQRIAIAEACGWVDICTHEIAGRTVYYGWHPTLHPKKTRRYEAPMPNYLNDLNAMHKAEEALLGKDWDELLWAKYQDWLYTIIEAHRHVINATAAQRAEALLRTIGKWEDGK